MNIFQNSSLKLCKNFRCVLTFIFDNENFLLIHRINLQSRTVVNLIASKINLHKNRSGDFILAPTQRRQINVQQKHSSTNRRMLQPDDQNVTSSSQSPSPSLIITVDEQFDVLRQLCRSALDHYTQCTNKTELERRMENAFNQILSELDEVLPLYKEIQGFAHEYDYDVTHPYNGFRSFLYVIDKCMQHTTRITKYIDAHKTSLSFAIKRHQYVKEIEACSLLILNLCCCLEHLITLREWTKKGELFPSTPHTAKELLVRAHKIDQYSFYGRCLGFQFEKTMQAILKVILTSMAGFSKAFYYDGNVVTKTTVSFYNSGKYYFDAEARARRIVNVSQNAGVDFCKAFWFLAENRFMYSLPVIAGARVKINRVFQIPPEPLQTLCITTGQMLDVPVPSSHIGPGSVKARLISNVERVGMIGEHGNALKTKFSSPQQPSDYLIIHCHGGGFIACSSASHEVYLREWTIDLNVPIVSIDYSLAPKAPYPRALEEIYYAYCWAIKNSSLLGTTGKRIILAGDSAGANLILGCTMKCIETGIRRPDGIFMAYCPTLVDFVPSPARLLSLMDPLLPFGFMMQCLKAYSAPSLKIICDNKKKLEDTNSIKYAGRDESQNSFHKSKGKENLAPNSLVNGDGSISCLPDDDKFVQDLKKKYGSSDAKNEIPIHENIDEIRYNTNEDNVIIEVGKEMCEENMNVRRKLEQFRTSISAKVNHLAHPAKNQQKSPRPKRILQDLDALMEKSASEEFTFQVPNDPKLSPYHASDAELREMPPIKIVTTNLDPCLDDCIMYGKRLRLLGNPVDLDVLTGLPHGFLNFTLLSKEAHEGNKLCINRIKELMNNKKNK